MAASTDATCSALTASQSAWDRHQIATSTCQGSSSATQTCLGIEIPEDLTAEDMFTNEFIDDSIGL